MKPLVIVLGKNYSTALGVIRAFWQENYLIDLFYVAGKKGDSNIASGSKCIRRCIEHIGRTDQIIVNRLLDEYKNDTHRCVLFPTDDYTASLIDRYRDTLKEYFDMPYIEGNRPGTITYMMNKTVQLEYAIKYDFNVAKSWQIDLQVDKISIPKDITYPCFCKPETSAKGFKSEICTCTSESELKSKIKELREREKNRTILIQEFLQIEEEYSISGVCLGDSVILPALLKKLCIAEHEKGVTLLGRVDPFDEIGEVKDKLEKLLLSLQYYGMIDIELIRCGNRIYFNELNFRSSGVCYGIIAAGINLPVILVENLLGIKTEQNLNNINYGLKFLYDKAAWEDYIFGDISKEEFKKYLSMADVFILANKDDPKPGMFFTKMMKCIKYQVKIKKLIKSMLPYKYIKTLLRKN